jgi:hypothetical protein
MPPLSCKLLGKVDMCIQENSIGKPPKPAVDYMLPLFRLVTHFHPIRDTQDPMKPYKLLLTFNMVV